MAISNFIGEIWSAQILEALHKTLVYGQSNVVNRNYEGEIRGKGSTVHINSHGPITVAPYVKAVGLSDPEDLTDAGAELVITEAQSFNFRIDDIDKAQMNVNLMESATRDAAYRLGDVADQFLAGLMEEDAGNTLDPAALDLDEVLVRDLLIDIKTALDEANAPKQGRWVILPPWVVGFMLKEGLITHNTTWSGVEGAMKNGQITRLFGFDLLESNNVPAETVNYTVLAGVPQAVTYAESVNEVEAYRPDKFIADALRGLHVYGAEVVRPDCLASVVVSDGSGA
ncbi:phage major capsid protein [Candidatus Methanocrinis natronophilus]|uniref:P22 coat protein - protein 5 domain protein n=1 Tax=Candidatus Methanocrinis natronophilus TaxID=3033396 RepID=A0ABT5XAH5_9EURY|nr:P22 coat protein - protein 5 domain protein [Candidatus Methanocrinis natronophilus]MDF0591662.1 P22 coat protein - protein 5 domain protein [Candidatus Methanocrinis natronophilus]